MGRDDQTLVGGISELGDMAQHSRFEEFHSGTLCHEMSLCKHFTIKTSLLLALGGSFSFVISQDS